MLQTEMKEPRNPLRSQLQTPHEGRVLSEEEATCAGGRRAPPPGALRFARDRCAREQGGGTVGAVSKKKLRVWIKGTFW